MPNTEASSVNYVPRVSPLRTAQLREERLRHEAEEEAFAVDAAAAITAYDSEADARSERDPLAGVREADLHLRFVRSALAQRANEPRFCAALQHYVRRAEADLEAEKAAAGEDSLIFVPCGPSDAHVSYVGYWYTRRAVAAFREAPSLARRPYVAYDGVEKLRFSTPESAEDFARSRQGVR